MSLRALIEGKARRTAMLPLLVGDLAAADRDVQTVRAALKLTQEGRPAKSRPTKAEVKLRADLDAALQRRAECVVEIELQSLPPDEWDEMFGSLEEGDNGDIDMTSIHAPLLAASCTDPELQDAEWWAVQLKAPHWSKGDRAVITQTLLELNVSAPMGVPGKG